MTIWACQAGGRLCRKAGVFTIVEGRRMVEAPEIQTDRASRAGLARESQAARHARLAGGKLGQVYRGKVIITKPRASIGRMQEASIPEGVHWDLFLADRYFLNAEPPALRLALFLGDVTTMLEIRASSLDVGAGA